MQPDDRGPRRPTYTAREALGALVSTMLVVAVAAGLLILLIAGLVRLGTWVL